MKFIKLATTDEAGVYFVNPTEIRYVRPLLGGEAPKLRHAPGCVVILEGLKIVCTEPVEAVVRLIDDALELPGYGHTSSVEVSAA